MNRQKGTSKQIAVRFKETELKLIDKKRKAGTKQEIPRSNFIRGRTLQVKCMCGK